MNSLFGIIYFVHDDMGQEFRLNIIPTILHSTFHGNIKIILIHNKRKLFKSSSEQEFVTYRTVVSEVKQENNKPFFKVINDSLSDWKAAFLFSFNVLSDHGISRRIGIITLSHSNGFAINRNNETAALRIVKMWNFLRRLFRKKPAPEFSYIEKITASGDLFVNAETILGTIQVPALPNEINNDRLAVYKSEYSRLGDSDFCKKYEGLFFSEFSKFMQDTLVDEKGIGKVTFYISSNCNFQLYDNMYLFSHVSEFVMGAQSFNSSSFWHFPSIVDAIQENIKKTGKDISTAVFNRCKKKFEAERTERTEHYFLSDTSHFSSLHEVFEEIILVLIANIKAIPDFKTNLISQIGKLSRTSDDNGIPYFDVLAFLTAANDVAGKKFDASINEFRNLLRTKIVISDFPSASSHSGFSLYLPINQKEFNVLNGADCNYFIQANRNNFSLNSKFDEFLTFLYQ